MCTVTSGVSKPEAMEDPVVQPGNGAIASKGKNHRNSRKDYIPRKVIRIDVDVNVREENEVAETSTSDTQKDSTKSDKLEEVIKKRAAVAQARKAKQEEAAKAAQKAYEEHYKKRQEENAVHLKNQIARRAEARSNYRKIMSKARPGECLECFIEVLHNCFVSCMYRIRPSQQVPGPERAPREVLQGGHAGLLQESPVSNGESNRRGQTQHVQVRRSLEVDGPCAFACDGETKSDSRAERARLSGEEERGYLHYGSCPLLRLLHLRVPVSVLLWPPG